MGKVQKINSITNKFWLGCKVIKIEIVKDGKIKVKSTLIDKVFIIA